jgi:hypothetical protein
MGFGRNYKKRLMVFERKALRRNFGATKERDGTWRIKTNDELDKLIRRENIVLDIKTYGRRQKVWYVGQSVLMSACFNHKYL